MKLNIFSSFLILLLTPKLIITTAKLEAVIKFLFLNEKTQIDKKNQNQSKTKTKPTMCKRVSKRTWKLTWHNPMESQENDLCKLFLVTFWQCKIIFVSRREKSCNNWEMQWWVSSGDLQLCRWMGQTTSFTYSVERCLHYRKVLVKDDT